MNWFQCQSVAEICRNPKIILQLDQQVKTFLFYLDGRCNSLMRNLLSGTPISVVFFDIVAQLSFIFLVLCEDFFRISFVMICIVHYFGILLNLLISMLDWMFWMNRIFPRLVIHLKHSIVYTIIFFALNSRYKRRFVQIYNTRLVYQPLQVFPNYKCVFVLVIVLNFTFDTFIFWRFVPYCY